MDELAQCQWLVYGLYDPGSGGLHYVGMTGRGLRRRLERHISQAKRHAGLGRPIGRWLLDLRSRGLKPEIRTISAWDNRASAIRAERRAIWENSAPGRSNLANLSSRHFGCDCSDCLRVTA